MASGRRSAGERVLEGKHVIGLFLLMLLFSGVFFTLGYVMGRNQFEGQVQAQTPFPHHTEPAYVPKSEPAQKKSLQPPVAESDTDPATASTDKATDGGWDFSRTSSPATSEPRLDPAPKPTAVATTSAASKTSNSKVKPEPSNAPAVKSVKVTTPPQPLVPAGSFLLQVAALSKRDDALAVATSLQNKHFAAYVTPPQRDKYFRVQVGPFKDQKSADAVKKGLEGAGYKAFYVKH